MHVQDMRVGLNRHPLISERFFDLCGRILNRDLALLGLRQHDRTFGHLSTERVADIDFFAQLVTRFSSRLNIATHQYLHEGAIRIA
jgi:hypothetical protein